MKLLFHGREDDQVSMRRLPVACEAAPLTEALPAAGGPPAYPHEAGWCRFPATQAVCDAGGGGEVRRRVVALDGLEASWAFDGWDAPNPLVAHHTGYLRPRPVLVWRRPAR